MNSLARIVPWRAAAFLLSSSIECPAQGKKGGGGGSGAGTYSIVEGVNATGHICGYGDVGSRNFQRHGFLLVPN